VDNVYSEGVFVGYRYLDAQGEAVLFPFGFGLSYTTFAYSEVAVSPRSSTAGQPVMVTCVVENTGVVAGDEIVQLYIHDVAASLPRPPRELKGFHRVSLQPGEKRTVTFRLEDDAFAFYDVTVHRWRVEPGDFAVQVGASSRDIRLEASLTKTG
jgi:beta-glucosidase